MINDFTFFHNNINQNQLDNPLTLAQKYIAKAQEYLLNKEPCLALTSLNNADEILTKHGINNKDYSAIMEEISEESHYMIKTKGFDA